MSLEQKLEFFKLLVKVGFKEIEVGFPAASQIEFDFLRHLIEHDMIPDDVYVQVLTQCREELIARTFESIQGCKQAIVHIYNSTSTLQRDVVFHMDRPHIVDIAVKGTELVKKYAADFPGKIVLEYSPESFTGTELDFALEICTAVQKTWGATKENPIIINLPSTVEMNTPNVYADQIEWMNRHFENRESIILSIHPHNDRGTGVASAELALLAGAERVEGTLFGNGERTGNADILTVAMNLFSHGVDPQLDFSDMPKVVEMYEKFTDLKVSPRQPYGGSLVFAAFSGSHQDAIAKGMHHIETNHPDKWSCPYLLIDPHDVGREYEADVIRINSQSGKGGVAYVLETNYGYDIPKKMREEIGYLMKHISDEAHKELSPAEIHRIFQQQYVNRKDKISIEDATFSRGENDIMKVSIEATIYGEHLSLKGEGNGRLDAVTTALRNSHYSLEYDFVTYHEHALESESNSRAASYVAISKDGETFWGVGIHNDIIYASINALISAINRAF